MLQIGEPPNPSATYTRDSIGLLLLELVGDGSATSKEEPKADEESAGEHRLELVSIGPDADTMDFVLLVRWRVRAWEGIPGQKQKVTKEFVVAMGWHYLEPKKAEREALVTIPGGAWDAADPVSLDEMLELA